MVKQDEIKSNFIGLRFSSEENLDLILSAKNSGSTISDYIREAVREKMSRENGSYLEKRKKELLQELEEIKQQQNLLDKKDEEKKNLPEIEINFLIEAKRRIERNPQFLEGLINKYMNEFGKVYKVSRKDFYELIAEAETQHSVQQLNSEVAINDDSRLLQQEVSATS